MDKRISSSFTFFSKIIFPIVWISGVGIVTLIMFFAPFEVSPPVAAKLTFLILWMISSSFVLWFAIKLKSVFMNDKSLIVKDYSKKIAIPYIKVMEVRDIHYINQRIIKLHIHPECDFGSTIIFIPTFKIFNPINQHPIVAELNQKINQSIKKVG